ncbi:MAG: hypothetical protein JW995_05055 [Melioribacteraceae bacterium]|nr:hypothetical protein [Melioribacteraceae bacterium]
MQSKISSTRLIIGLLILTLGVLFLLSNFDIIDYSIPWFILDWRTILIIIGLIILATTGNRSTGSILIGIGLIFHFPEFWPLILIFLGVYIILRTGGLVKFSSGSMTEKADFLSSGDYLNELAIFGGGKKYIKSTNFRGGKITAFFGGSEIDLIDSKLADGESTLDLFALFGGTTILIPSDWSVEIDMIPIFGGFADNRRIDPDLVPQPGRTLKIKGLVLFGGGEIKN